MSDSMVQRIEKDLIGELSIPAQQYYGIQTARALNNFNLSHNKLNHYPVFIKALAMVKLACATANFKLNLLSQYKYQAIVFLLNDF